VCGLGGNKSRRLDDGLMGVCDMCHEQGVEAELQVFLPLNDSSGPYAKDYSGKNFLSGYGSSTHYLSGSVALTGQSAHFAGVGNYPYAGVSLGSVDLSSSASFTFSGFFALDTVVSGLGGGI